MSNTLKVQELIDMCKLHPENESARKLKEDLEKAQINHAKNQELFDIDFFIRIWNNDIKLITESGEIDIRKKLQSDTDIVKYIDDVLEKTKVEFKNEKAKEIYSHILSDIKEKIYGVKDRLANKQEKDVIISIENKEVDFSLTVYRTGNIISFSQSSLGKLDFSKDK